MNKKYDVIILGGGLAGYYSAKALKKGGKSVALIEKDTLGGTSLRWGALPVKRALDFFKERKGSKEELLKTWEDSLKELENRINRSILDMNIDIYYGEGELISKETVKVNNEILIGEYIIIATGTSPVSIENICIDRENIITHKEAISLENIPKSIVILGGSVEGIEFASLYAELGVKVTVIEKEDNILIGYDRDLVEPIENHLLKKGVNIITGKSAKSSYIEDDKVKIVLEDNNVIEGDKALVTLFRKPNFPKGIERLNIDIDESRILVDDNLRTEEKNIFAIGDINGIIGLGNVAINQGLQVAEYIISGKKVSMNYKPLPRAVFTLPEIAGIGKQEEELKGIKYKVGYCYFKDTWRGWARDIDDGFVKIIVDDRRNLLGIWMVGNLVSEYIGMLSPIFNGSITVDHVKTNLIIHPTLTEVILEAIFNIES